jgi:hypothetical protein
VNWLVMPKEMYDSLHGGLRFLDWLFVTKKMEIELIVNLDIEVDSFDIM